MKIKRTYTAYTRNGERIVSAELCKLFLYGQVLRLRHDTTGTAADVAYAAGRYMRHDAQVVRRVN